MEKEHHYKKFENDLKNGIIKNVLLLYGKEQYLVKWAISAVVKKYVNDEYRVFDFFEIDPEKATASDIIESCETLSLFSERRVVCLPGFAPVSEGKLKNFSEQDEKLLADYMNEIPDTCILIMTSEKIDGRRKLCKEIASRGGAYNFEPLDERTLRAFIEKHFNLEGKNIKASVIGELIACSGYFHKETGYTLFNLENEIKKISAHCEGDEISLSDVLEAVSGDDETYIFALIDAIGRNEKPEAFRLLHNIIGSGSDYYRILSLIASHFEIILEFKELKEEGKPLSQMQRVLGVHEFRLRKAAGTAGLYSKTKLKKILKEIYQIEKMHKTGVMDPVLALEILISEV